MSANPKEIRKKALLECRRLGFAQQSFLSDALKQGAMAQDEYDALSKKIADINYDLLVKIDGPAGPLVNRK